MPEPAVKPAHRRQDAGLVRPSGGKGRMPEPAV